MLQCHVWGQSDDVSDDCNISCEMSRAADNTEHSLFMINEFPPEFATKII